MRPIWTGTLSFGLINIPVRLYSASVSRQFNFKLLAKEDLCPIGYVRVCKNDHREVSYNDIVKGYEYQKGDYIVLQDEDFKKANAKKTESIEVLNFTSETKIDSTLLEKPYYMEPDKKASKAYVLLREAMKKSGKVAIARFVLRSKEHIGMLKAEENVIMLIQMRYASEMRPSDELNIPEKSKYSKKEIEMAISLINQLTEPFKAEKYKDTYSKELEKVIEQKAKGKKIKSVRQIPLKETSSDEIFAALKKSLERQRARTG